VKTCIALRHVPFESLGQLEPVLTAQGFDIRLIDVPVSGLNADLIKDADLLVVLGGPISVYEEHLYPWLLDELRLIEWRLSHQKPTLGLCLGAQFMARALGARVYPGVKKEIGWSPLVLTEAGQQCFLSEIRERAVLHWHGDTFDLPSGATLLASTDLTPHQAFQYGNHAVALQFHLEVTAEHLEAWYVGHTCELSHWGQMSIPELRDLGLKQGPLLAPYAGLALSRLLREIQG
jgi:GMP synthase (glutamine-hydrolysing)